MSLVSAILFNEPPPPFEGQIRRHYLLDEVERRFLGREHKEPIKPKEMKVRVIKTKEPKPEKPPKVMKPPKTKKVKLPRNRKIAAPHKRADAIKRYRLVFESLGWEADTNQISAAMKMANRNCVRYLSKMRGILWDSLGHKYPANKRSPYLWRWKHAAEL